MSAKWHIVLDLHDEGGGAAVAAPSSPSPAPTASNAPAPQASAPQTQAATENVQTQPSESQGANAQSSDAGTKQNDNGVVAKAGGMEVVKDPVTGKRTLRIAQEQANTQENTQDNANDLQGYDVNVAGMTEGFANQTPAEPPVPTGKYDLTEFSQAIASGTVDEARVPDEFKAQYADYRIQQARQAFAEQQRLQAEQKAAVQKQLSPEEQATAMKDFYKALEAEAKKQAMEALNIADEDAVADLEFEDEDKYNLYQSVVQSNKMRLEWQLQQSAAADREAKANQQRIYDGMNQFIAQAKATEPNFNAIDRIMEQRIQDLPMKEARPIENAINAAKNGNVTEEQAELLRKYYEDTRRAYYAGRAGVSTVPQVNRPPVLERPGNGQATANEYRPDYSALRNAKNPKAKAAWLNDYFNKLGNRNG